MFDYENSSQIIEDFKQNLTEVNEKFQHRQNTIEQLNNEIIQLKQKCEQSDIRLQQYQVCLDFLNKNSSIESIFSSLSTIHQLSMYMNNKSKI